MIEFQNVSKTYPGAVDAVSGFSLVVPSHKIVVLLGSSGSGKTTLLRMVNRMVNPDTGRVLIDDEDVAARPVVELRRSIGYVMQQGGLMPHRTVADNIATVPQLNGVPRDKARQAAVELLERVGLEPSLASRYPGELSGGQQQRVGVARALAADPNILLMDEPFGAVDPIVRRDLQDELLRLQAVLGKTIVFVTHDVNEAFRLADEVVLLRELAAIAQQGTPAQIMAAPADDFVADFIGAGGADQQLSTVKADGRTLVVDGGGRPLGVLA